ncbi:hypothetical protein, partial [Stenotrophomonas sp. S41]|uniref:hypothetical protein n=1 Tax=Stenotrophomonas sp. S41 TaxID=2767464 RepID=UPI001F2FAFD2
PSVPLKNMAAIGGAMTTRWKSTAAGGEMKLDSVNSAFQGTAHPSQTTLQSDPHSFPAIAAKEKASGVRTTLENYLALL